MKINKSFSNLLVFFFILLLSACGSKAPSSSAEAQTTPPAPEPEVTIQTCSKLKDAVTALSLLKETEIAHLKEICQNKERCFESIQNSLIVYKIELTPTQALDVYSELMK